MATVHWDDITIGGERSAVELYIMKQVIGEDADLEKIGRILNRVIKWGRGGITIEADQRHVRGIFKDLTTPRNMDKKKDDNSRYDGSKEENQCKQGQRQTEHDWDDAVDGDDSSRVPGCVAHRE